MRKTTLFLTVSTLTISSMICASAQTVTFKSRLGYSMQVPRSWEKQPRSAMLDVMFTTRNPGGASPNFNVFTIGKGLSLGELEKTADKPFRSFPGFKVLRRQQFSFHGDPAFLWEATYNASRFPENQHHKQITVMHQGRPYFFTANAPVSRWKNLQPIFERIFTSVRFIK